MWYYSADMNNVFLYKVKPSVLIRNTDVFFFTISINTYMKITALNYSLGTLNPSYSSRVPYDQDKEWIPSDISHLNKT